MKVDFAARDAEYRRVLGIGPDGRLPGGERAHGVESRRRGPGTKRVRPSYKSRRQSPGRERYNAYIASSAWLAKRLEYFEVFGTRCRVPLCDFNGPVDVHHHTYARFGCESIRDLVGLCPWHHASVHDLHRRNTTWSLTRATESVTQLRLH